MYLYSIYLRRGDFRRSDRSDPATLRTFLLGLLRRRLLASLATRRLVLGMELFLRVN